MNLVSLTLESTLSTPRIAHSHLMVLIEKSRYLKPINLLEVCGQVKIAWTFN